MTSTSKHVKHAKLTRPTSGDYGRNELAIIGAPCGVIQDLAKRMGQHLSGRWNVAYVDADHGSEDSSVNNDPFAATFTDKIDFRRTDTLDNPNPFALRNAMNPHDLILINGNHYRGLAQIVIIDERKKESLQRKLDRLTDVQLVILAEETPIYDFLEDYVGDDIPVHHIDDVEGINAWCDSYLEAVLSSMNGLVLAGGKSQRLGFDKTLIDYHGKPHRQHLAEMLQVRCENVYLSLRDDQDESKVGIFETVKDEFTGLGPFGGILTAFKRDPNKAWLVIASDLPLISNATLEQLIQSRNPSKVATAFHNETTGFPDPLITIWEPRAYPVLLSFLAQGYSCPRKVLINSDIEEVTPDSSHWLTNVNTQQDLDKVKELLEKK